MVFWPIRLVMWNWFAKLFYLQLIAFWKNFGRLNPFWYPSERSFCMLLVDVFWCFLFKNPHFDWYFFVKKGMIQVIDLLKCEAMQVTLNILYSLFNCRIIDSSRSGNWRRPAFDIDSTNLHWRNIAWCVVICSIAILGRHAIWSVSRISS